MTQETTWRPDTPYPKGSIQWIDGCRWICKQSHTSENEFNKKLWSKIDKAKDQIEPDMSTKLFTSMSKEYYDNVGRAMLRSYKVNWSRLAPMYVYNEAAFRVKVKGVTSLGWQLGNDYLSFMRRHTNDKVKTFAKKGFSVIHAMENLDCDKLVWIDADVIFTQEMPSNMFDLLCPQDALSAHFSVWHEVDGKHYHSCETGFFILNKKHPMFEEFLNTYKNIYLRDDAADLRRFYDGEVYGKTVKILEAKGAKMVNLNPGPHKTPISRSVLAPYLSHFKAGLKDKVDFDALVNEVAPGSIEEHDEE